MLSDEEQIRALVQTWQAATQAGDTETVLRLMTERAGHPLTILRRVSGTWLLA